MLSSEKLKGENTFVEPFFLPKVMSQINSPRSNVHQIIMSRVKSKQTDFNSNSGESDHNEFKGLEGHSIIYFGPGEWDGMWRNRHQLMSRFARHNMVMYVEPLYSIFRFRKHLKRKDKRISDLCRLMHSRRITQKADRLFIYHSPIFIPILGRFPFDIISWWAWLLLFKKTMKNLGFTSPIIWLSQPKMGYFIGKLNEKLIIYHVVDEYLAYEGMSKQRRLQIEASEQELLRRADLVIVVSENLYKTKRPFNEHTYLVPNGVDKESYDRALRENNQAPADLVGLPKPIIGYSGLISARLDLELICYLANTFSEYSFVFIGSMDSRGCEACLRKLEKMKNVYFLGNKKIDSVPYYVKSFDVCMVPYNFNEETKNLSALKLYDFMAAGKPSVTTNFPAVKEFSDIVYISQSKEDFANCIARALKENDHNMILKRRKFASQNTWDHRVVQLSRLMEQSLVRRK